MSDKSPPQQRWWNIEGWGLRRKVTAVLAVPVTVAMVLGGLRVENELSNAVHFSSAADQVAAVPDIVDFSTAFATATADAAVGTATPEEMAALGDAFGTIAAITENPELDPAVTADLSRTAATAQSLYTKIQAGPVPIEEIGAVTNEVRDSLNRVVEAILGEVDDREIIGYGDQLINAWYSQRYLFGQVLGLLQLIDDPTQPGTALVSASGAELAMLDLLARSYLMADQQIAELRAGVQERADMVDAAGSGPLPILDIRASLLDSVDIYGTIIDEASSQVSTTIQDRAAETRSAALRDTAIVLAALLAALVLALLVSRSLVGPIRRLRYGTLKVARQELPEAIDRIKVGDNIEDIEFTRVPVHTTEEIGQLARAVDDMHGQALRLAGEQAHLRLQISDMFETLARRSKSLVEQQLGLIERLEYEEKDPARLESLFRLDHLAARMRRNGDNLLILSGTRTRRGHSAPVQLGDILRAAMSEVEDYQRVQIGSTPDGALSGAVATDIVHLLAELVDNSLRASPPDSNVTFSFARAVDGGLLVEIADRGIGIPADELESINQRLAKGDEVGPDTARHMGLFVVSRLAERHGLTVRLRPTFDTARNPGITASVHIPDVLLVS
ncbi:ATP-binding protein, partial [Rhodococcus pyridinivorans]